MSIAKDIEKMGFDKDQIAMECLKKSAVAKFKGGDWEYKFDDESFVIISAIPGGAEFDFYPSRDEIDSVFNQYRSEQNDEVCDVPLSVIDKTVGVDDGIVMLEYLWGYEFQKSLKDDHVEIFGVQR